MSFLEAIKTVSLLRESPWRTGIKDSALGAKAYAATIEEVARLVGGVVTQSWRPIVERPLEVEVLILPCSGIRGWIAFACISPLATVARGTTASQGKTQSFGRTGSGAAT